MANVSGARKLRWGVLGVAKIGTTKVIPAMQRGRLSDVVAIASRDAAGRRRRRRSSASRRRYGSYEELLADPDIDAVYNPLPNHLHVPWTIRAAEAGKHVLCEKPIGLSAAEARSADRRARPHRRQDPGSVHGAHASAVARGARARARRAASASCGRCSGTSATSTTTRPTSATSRSSAAAA